MRRHLAGFLVLAIHVFAAEATSQCEREWMPGFPVTGVHGEVWAIAIGPGGDVVVGGNFDAAGSLSTSGVARWDGENWHAYGSGVQGRVRAIAFMPSGDMVVGGRFTMAGGVECNHIARWDGKAWHALGTGMTPQHPSNDVVVALCADAGGNLVAGGSFPAAGGATVNNVARWDGQSWMPMGAGLNNFVSALTVLPGGDLVAGGNFQQSGTTPLHKIARWNGEAWVSMNSPAFSFDSIVRALKVLSNGDLVAAGKLSGGQIINAMRWDGQQWHAMQCPEFVRALAELPGGDLIAVGDLNQSVQRWSGSGWESLALAVGGWLYAAAATSDGALIVGGTFSDFYDMRTVAHSRGTAVLHQGEWSQWFGRRGFFADTLLELPSGDLLATGEFETVGGVLARRAALFTAGQWAPFNTLENPRLHATALSGDGTIFGATSTAGLGSPDRIVRWTGDSWQEVAVFEGIVSKLLVASGGDLIAVGRGLPPYNPPLVRRWNGELWHSMGFSQISGDLRSVVELSGGRIAVASKSFAAYIMVNVGEKWTMLAFGTTGTFNDLVVTPSGDLVACGQFSTISGIPASNVALWNGSEWSAMGPGLASAPQALTLDADGAVVALGSGLDAAGNSMLRWDGESWAPLPGGSPAGLVRAANFAPYGDVVSVGMFAIAGDHISSNFARFACPPPECYPNCDYSTTPPVLNVADFQCFLQKFAQGDAYANCDQSTQPPVLNIADFACFIGRFAAGCP
jgi:trimeric autotransporter adhesin